MSETTTPIASRGFWRRLSGPLAAFAIAVWAHHDGLAPAIGITLAITTWCALWWLLEAVPHAITALLPLALFPVLGVLEPEQVANAYGNPLILLLAGGFMLAAALERNGAHRRMALAMVRLVGGGSGRRLIWGFALATGLTSMWISNTATTLMMLPVAMAVLERYPDPRLAAPLILAIAYSASIGGLGTPIGSPPNLVFMQVYEQSTGAALGFIDWMSFGIPTVALFLPAAALWLARGLSATPAATLPDLGPWHSGERRVLTVFALVALAWMTRSEPFGGWSAWLDLPGTNDASIALLGVVAMALVPDGRGGRLLDWQTAERIPWGALILFGGGIAIATAFQTSGLSELAAAHMQGLFDLPLLVRIALIAAAVSLMSEIASNTATAVLLMPILAAAGTALGIDPALLMVPAVLSASCSFMLPVATAPNAIAFASGRVGAIDMLRHGAVLNLIGVVVVTLIAFWFLR
ncbi:MAG TPA: sodium:dicarboxylate symporter [Xanthomonadales bacterium]|nr:sodium:dicarboxylate symporter [Xanthomonadales bacterium]